MRRAAMNCAVLALAAWALVVAAPAQAQTASPPPATETVTLKDPAAYAQVLNEMGYEARVLPVSKDGHSVPVMFQSGSLRVVSALGQCENGVNCRGVMLGAYFGQTSAPPEWFALENAKYDLVKVWQTTSFHLAVTYMLRAEGMPRPAFRDTLEMFMRSAAAVAADGVKAGYFPPPPAAATSATRGTAPAVPTAPPPHP